MRMPNISSGSVSNEVVLEHVARWNWALRYVRYSVHPRNAVLMETVKVYTRRLRRQSIGHVDYNPVALAHLFAKPIM